MDLAKLPISEPPDPCGDPEVRTWLARFEFLHRTRDENKFEYDRICDWLVGNVNCVFAALDEDEPLLRWRAAYFAIALYREKRVELILRAIEVANANVRTQLASQLVSIADPQVEDRLLELATTDPVPDVRGAACRGLAGQKPLSVIPVLIRVMDNDHASDKHGYRVSMRAACALDEMIGTDFMARRFPAGTIVAGSPARPNAVREHALAYLARLRRPSRCKQAKGVSRRSSPRA